MVLGSYLTGVTVIAALALVWVCVQNAWRTTCADVHPMSDVLTERVRCDGCAHEPVCAQRQRGESS